MQRAVSGPVKGRFPLAVPAVLFFVAVITRIPFRSRILFSWDSVQFALATEHYDITVHQPHPPGYFLYVMAGKLLNLFTNDPNASFVGLSIVMSGFSIVALYMLAREMYDERTALYASLLALSSPLYWLYGGVAATYVPEAFFCTLVAYLSWKILKGEDRNIWLLAVVLAVAGGVRQSTVVFLAPMVLYAIRRVSFKRLVPPAGLFAVLTAGWFVPMITMTGGYGRYRAAVDELWRFGFGSMSVFTAGFQNVPVFAKALGVFAFYGLGIGVGFVVAYIVLGFGAAIRGLLSQRGMFLALWVAPPVIFFVLIAVNVASPGLALIYTPALIVVTVRAVVSLAGRFERYCTTAVAIAMAAIIVFNGYLFLFGTSSVSYGALRVQSGYLAAFGDAVRSNFPPGETVILSTMYFYVGARHFMYYLPEYRVYVMDEAKGEGSPEGEVRRKVFWGWNRRTYRSDFALIPAGVKYFINPLVDEKFVKRIRRTVGEKSVRVLKDDLGRNLAVYGDAALAPRIYYGVRFQFEGDRKR